uniref:Uncharacterized protein n=1 Tax=Octopus bimaculoides TaxID=37653 RepID=A0A0L8GJX8_OCTBM
MIHNSYAKRKISFFLILLLLRHFSSPSSLTFPHMQKITLSTVLYLKRTNTH